MTVAAAKTSTEARIMALSGTKPSECSCDSCKRLCHTPCIGTPEDIEKLINAGYGDRLAPSLWCVGMLNGLTRTPIKMIMPIREESGWCTFRLPDGLCELHEKGLKPLEGKLASCRPKPKGWTLQRDFTWLIAKEWLPYQELFNRKGI